MKFKIIDDLAIFLDNIVPENHLSKLHEFLLSGAIFTEASKVLAILIIFIIISEIALALTLTIINLPVSVLILPFFAIPGLFTYVIVQQEKRAQEIEKTAPDFLRQLSSMLQVGLSFENAMEDMSQYGEGPLYDEMILWFCPFLIFLYFYNNKLNKNYKLVPTDIVTRLIHM